jgi:hypothetical protein
MQKEKVAIVVDNQLLATDKIIKDLGDKYGEIEIFDFSEFDCLNFSFWKLKRLIHKVEALDLSSFDKVYTISVGFANGIITNVDTLHTNILVSWPDWYYSPEKTFLKHSVRMWLDLALERAERNEVLLSELGTRTEFELYKKIERKKLSEQKEFGDHYVCFASRNTPFLEEVARTFNHTGKKVYIVGQRNKLNGFSDFSDNVEFIGINELDSSVLNAKGILFDQYFNNYDCLVKNLEFSTGCMVYRNKFMSNFLGKKSVYELTDIDSFENEIAKFVSWAKINKSGLSLPKI